MKDAHLVFWAALQGIETKTPGYTGRFHWRVRNRFQENESRG